MNCAISLLTASICTPSSTAASWSPGCCSVWSLRTSWVWYIGTKQRTTTVSTNTFPFAMRNGTLLGVAYLCQSSMPVWFAMCVRARSSSMVSTGLLSKSSPLICSIAMFLSSLTVAASRAIVGQDAPLLCFFFFLLSTGQNMPGSCCCSSATTTASSASMEATGCVVSAINDPCGVFRFTARWGDLCDLQPKPGLTVRHAAPHAPEPF
mmetsp:Transcript_8853/g.23475  ORF Transcript_8853/g.23475 Transcript_8853/m.23475 type:complete len:208 (+) Transcript_8853:324-947(+)